MYYHLPLLLCLLLPVQALIAQVTRITEYYDPATRQSVRESYTVLERDPSVRHGTYAFYSETGMLLTEIEYNDGRETGRKMERDEFSGMLKYIGYYLDPENYWYFHFLTDIQGRLIMNYERKQDGITDKHLPPGRAKEIVDSLHNILRSRNVEKIKPYRDFLLKHDFKIERLYIGADGEKVLNELGRYLIHKFFSMSENITEFSENERIISQFATRTGQYYSSRLPSLFNGKLKYLIGDISKYQANDSIEEKFVMSFHLARQIRRIEPLCEQLLETDSLLIRRKDFLTSHYANKISMLVLYNNSILPLLDSITRVYDSEDSLELKLGMGSGLLRSTEPFERYYEELRQQDSLIDRLSDPLFEKFKRHFPDAFQQDLNHIRTYTGNYDTLSFIEKKVSFGREVLRELASLSDKFDTLSRQQQFFTTVFPDAVSFYKDNQPNIYQHEIDPILIRLAAYDKTDRLDDKIRQGSVLVREATPLCSSIDSLRFYDSKIQSELPRIKANYQKFYKKIYLKEIEPKEADVNQYKNIAQTSAKLGKGREILTWLRHRDADFNELQDQMIRIDTMLERTGKLYRKRYSGINKQEISGLKSEFGEYKKAEFLEMRINKGRMIVEHLDYINSSYDTIVAIDSLLAGLLPLVKKHYKEDYPGIYESEVDVIRQQYNDFKQVPAADKLLQQCRDLRQKIRILDHRQPEISERHQEVLAEYERFRQLYRKNKERKLVAKRGETAYKFYFSQYRDAKTPEESLDLGKDLILFLKKVNSYAADDCSYLIKQLKNINKPQEIRKLFVI
ncbi:MAG TPA: hypothetical protein P5531_12675 [Bacteroidales bacterium]|nr:hypothetical protein [Bacteroidales bacterium]HSA43665.1 hypothetical protein [Bacteroidales bacterium]